MEPTTIVLALAAIAGLYMAWNIGANDVANAMGTSVGSGALTLRRAIIVAAIFEFGGAMLVGGTVTKTIRKGIVDVAAFGGDPMVIAIGMTCCLLAAALWLNIATYAGWPVSTTHSIVGAVVGFGLIAGGFSAVNWVVMGKIAASWVVSPMLGGFLGYLGFVFIKRRILNVDRPLLALRGWGPMMVFPIFAILALSVLFKGLKPLKLDLGLGPAFGIAVATGLLASIASVPLLRRFETSTPTARNGSFWFCKCSPPASWPLRMEATTSPTPWARWQRYLALLQETWAQRSPCPTTCF
jgi:PiT family inorganic phosphate transporter